jgi:hypothetical protein
MSIVYYLNFFFTMGYMEFCNKSCFCFTTEYTEFFTESRGAPLRPNAVTP